MRILISTPGRLKTVPMGGYCADALRALGHEVLLINSRGNFFDNFGDKVFSKPFAKEKKLANAHALRAIQKFKPDLFLAVFGFDISADTLKFLRAQKISTACWWLNDPFQFPRSLKNAALYDFYFTNAAGSVADYAAAGVKNVHFLPTACVPALHRSVPPLKKYSCDVCFAGDHSPLREELLLTLYKDCDLKILGPWAKKIAKNSPLRAHLINGFFTPAQMVQMFASSKITINIHTWHGRWDHGTNPRVFEAAGCGIFQLVDHRRELPELFEMGREMISYEKISDVLPLVKKYLADDASRQKIAQAAQARAHSQHTYVNRMKEMLEVVGKR